jgi:hypothetical protein
MLYAMKNSSLTDLSSPQAAKDYQLLKYPQTAKNLGVEVKRDDKKDQAFFNLMHDPNQLIKRSRGGATKYVSEREINSKLNSAS